MKMLTLAKQNFVYRKVFHLRIFYFYLKVRDISISTYELNIMLKLIFVFKIKQLDNFVENVIFSQAFKVNIFPTDEIIILYIKLKFICYMYKLYIGVDIYVLHQLIGKII